MDIGKRLRDIRVAKGLSQSDMEKRTGMLGCYISRVENGHTEPSIGTLEKLAQALGIEMSQLFVAGGGEPVPVHLPLKGGTREDPEELLKLVRAFRNLKRRDRQVVISVVAALERAS
jgi:transcriptional regulator with XRE-family HTH domain